MHDEAVEFFLLLFVFLKNGLPQKWFEQRVNGKAEEKANQNTCKTLKLSTCDSSRTYNRYAHLYIKSHCTIYNLYLYPSHIEFSPPLTTTVCVTFLTILCKYQNHVWNIYKKNTIHSSNTHRVTQHDIMALNPTQIDHKYIK